MVLTLSKNGRECSIISVLGLKRLEILSSIYTGFRDVALAEVSQQFVWWSQGKAAMIGLM